MTVAVHMYYNDYYYYYDIIIIEHSLRGNYNTLYRLSGANITRQYYVYCYIVYILAYINLI